MVFSLDLRAHSEVGLVRKNNQDSGYASPTMLMVADGMGGAAAGDLASTVAIREILRSDGRHSLAESHEVLAGALARANHTIADLVAQDPALDGMGTTVCGALFTGSDLGLLHLGDSRGYLLRGGVLHRLTHDHSWVQSLVDEGKITLAEAAVHPHRSLLLKVLNGQPSHEPDLDSVELALDDRLLFCSDGLCGFVPDSTIRQILDTTLGLDDAMAQLVAAAHAGGGADNITILLADVVPQDDALDARPSVVVGAARDGVVPETEEHTLVGLAGPEHLAPEPAATGERVVSTPADLAVLDELEASRYAPTATRRRPVLTALAATVALALVLGAGLWGGYRYSRTQYFVGADEQQVAVFNGLPGSVLGYRLADVTETSDVNLADLPPFYQQQVTSTIPVGSLAAARTAVGELRTRAQACIARRARDAGSTPTSSAPTPGASASASARPTGPATGPVTNTPISGTPATSTAGSPSASASAGSTLDQDC